MSCPVTSRNTSCQRCSEHEEFAFMEKAAWKSFNWVIKVKRESVVWQHWRKLWGGWENASYRDQEKWPGPAVPAWETGLYGGGNGSHWRCVRRHNKDSRLLGARKRRMWKILKMYSGFLLCYIGTLWRVEWCPPQVHVHSGPRSVASFGKRVFADVISEEASEELTLDLVWSLKPTTVVFIKRGEDTRTQGRRPCEDRAETGDSEPPGCGPGSWASWETDAAPPGPRAKGQFLLPPH